MESVYYRDFGAVGDGVTNDFDSIKLAHKYANENGLAVFADADKTYYIGRTHGEVVEIKTDTDWQGAKFIIDDSEITPEDIDREKPIFLILPDTEACVYTPDSFGTVGDAIRKINAEGGFCADRKTRLDLGLGFDAMVVISNDDKRVFIRYGLNKNAGSPQHELAIVSADGRISDTTPVYFDYEKVTRVEVFPISNKKIRVGNATVTTVANRAPRKYTYYQRGINISRSNTELYGIDFRIVGEGDSGAPYYGSISVNSCHGVTVKDSVLSAHKLYWLADNEKNPMGTYGITVTGANEVTFKNVTMHNFFIPGTENVSVYHGYWGIMGSNYCKNLTYDSCQLTRFDAHCGTCNANIVNSEIGLLSLIGNGLFRIENSVVYSDMAGALVVLRADYGSTWDGEFVIKNVKAKVSLEYDKDKFSLLGAAFTNHDFGYKCYMPRKITVDGFEVLSDKVREIALVSGSAAAEGVSREEFAGEKNKNPYSLPAVVTVKNNARGYLYTKPQISDYEKTSVEE